MTLATALKARGIDVHVLASRPSSAMPPFFLYRDIPVHSPIKLFQKGWAVRGDRTASRYVKRLGQWIEDNMAAQQVMFVNGAQEEALATIPAGEALKIPTAVRLGGAGQCSDFEFFRQSRVGKRCRQTLLNADAVIVQHADDHRQWIVQGGNDQTTHRIGPAIGTSKVTPEQRLATRQSLGAINGDLHVPADHAVLLSVQQMRSESGLATLVGSIYSLSQSVGRLQYWLIGDGPRRESIFGAIRADGLRQNLAMPGSFADMTDVFHSADLLVHNGDWGWEHLLPTAIGMGMPLVVANSLIARRFFSASSKLVKQRISDLVDSPNMPAPADAEPGQYVYWFESGQPKTLQRAVAAVVNRLDLAGEHSNRLRRTMQRDLAFDNVIDQYVHLLQRLAAKAAPQNVSGVSGRPS